MSALRLRWVAAVMAATVATGLAGCGSGAGRGAIRTSSRASTPPPSSTATTPPAVTTTTPAGTTTTVDLPGTGKPAVLLGDMNTPEQFIIGDLYADALGAEGYTVDPSHDIGPTSVSVAALSQGSLDIFPEYLDVYDTQVADDSAHFSSLVQAFDAGQTYATDHGQTLLTPTPFSDTSGIVVLTSFARAHDLHTMADLRRVQRLLTFGSPLEFSAEPDGLLTLEQAYHFTPAVTTPVTIGTQYRELDANAVQAAYDQTTDWELTDPTYTNLPDSDHVLGYGNVVPVVSASALSAEGPQFAETINRVDALLSTRAIRGLTAEMASATQPSEAAAEVAKEFLQGYGILPPPSWSTVTSTTATTPATLTTTTARTLTAATTPATQTRTARTLTAATTPATQTRTVTTLTAATTTATQTRTVTGRRRRVTSAP